MLGTLLANPNDAQAVLLASVAFFILLAGIAVYVVISAPRRAQMRLRKLIDDLDAMTKKFGEAERIGRFGSFIWDFEHPQASFWSPEMFELCGLVPRKGAPTIETLLLSIYEKDREAAAKEWLAAQHRPGPFAFSFRTVATSGEMHYLRVQGKSTVVDGSPRRIEGVARDFAKEAEIDKAKTEFVSLASHQLKTPVTSVKWLSEALLAGAAGALTDKQREYVTRMHHEEERMTDMINELLNVSRIELGTLPFTITQFDVCALLHEVFEEQRGAAQEKRVVVQISCAADLSAMHADQNLTRMILQNLLSNAIKYSKAGGTVECELSFGGLHNDALSIRVTDHGIGIPKEEEERVFERMHRAQNARTQVPDGTGLGLYLVKLIVERVQGKISFESHENVGTTFYVTLPLLWHIDPAPSFAQESQ